LVIGSVGEGYEETTSSGIAPEDVYTQDIRANIRDNLPNNHIQQSILEDIPVQRQFQTVLSEELIIYERFPDLIQTLNKSRENQEKSLNHSLKPLLAGGTLIIEPTVYNLNRPEFKSKDTMYGFLKIVDDTEMNFLSKYLMNGQDESAMTEEKKHLKDNLGRSDIAVANLMEACNIIMGVVSNNVSNDKDKFCATVANALKDPKQDLETEDTANDFIGYHSKLMRLIQCRDLLKDKDNLEGGSIKYGINPHNNREGFYLTIRKKSENA